MFRLFEKYYIFILLLTACTLPLRAGQVIDHIITGNTTLASDLTVTAGVSPGNSPGLVTFQGNVSFGSQSNILIELGGTIPGTEHDKIIFESDVTFGGQLEVVLYDGFVPGIGDSFDIFDFLPANLTGSFYAVSLPGLSPGLLWNTSQLYTTGTISVDYPPSITVTAPNTPIYLLSGSQYEITWTSLGAVDSVLLQYSANSGVRWIDIAVSPDTGTYNWTVPYDNSSHCLVKVSKGSDSTVFDISDSEFTIYTCTLTADFTGDCRVELEDFALLAQHWLLDYTSPAWDSLYDINEPADGIINMFDFATFAAQYLTSDIR